MKKFFVTLSLICLMGGHLLAQVSIDPALKEAIKTNLVTQVIVTFHGSGAPQPTQLSLLQQVGITKGLTFRALPIAGVLATAAQVNALALRPEVKSLYLNKKLDYKNFDANNLTGVKRLRADKTITAKNNGLPVSGKGIGVLINDSGVDGTHEDIKLGVHLVQNTLGSTNLNAYDAMLPVTYIEGVPNTDNNSGHGTHCTGTVGGNGARSSGKYEGAAPGASLLGYGSGAALLVLDAIGGFDYALTHQYQYNIRVISNSFGTSGDFDPADPLNVATKKASDRGMVVVFAAGNEGPGSDTHNPYAIAPWVISVGAGEKDGRLADFSSRGVKGEQGTFTVDGETFTFKNEPTIVAPGVGIVSTRVIGPVATLGIMDDVALEPAHIPFYTTMSGTSMATPHMAGVVALMLEAKPSLSPAQVKEIVQKTATNMPGKESWEVGAGYLNAYAAVDMVFRATNFGSTLNSTRRFTSTVDAQNAVQNFTINYNPVLAAGNQLTFFVAPGTNSLEAKITSTGVLGETGNPVNLIVLDPTGKQYRSGIPVTFTLSLDRSIAVAAPPSGTWTLKVEGLNGVAAPETITGSISQLTASGTTGLWDIPGHPAEASIKTAISNHLVDGLFGAYRPNDALTRLQLAEYLLMGQGVRQYMPTNGVPSFNDIAIEDVLLIESVATKGAALRDRNQQFNGVMLPTSSGRFSPYSNVDRASLAYSLVQGLGFQQQAQARTGKPISVTVNGKSVPVEDAASIPAGLEGYVSIALELNLINAFYTTTQGLFDLQPVIHANFKPRNFVNRGEFAVIVTRTFPQYEAVTQPLAARLSAETIVEPSAYPNPFSGSTTISYSLAKPDYVTVEVFNLMGARVRTLVQDYKPAGIHAVKFDGNELSSGSYLFKVNTSTGTSAKRMVLN